MIQCKHGLSIADHDNLYSGRVFGESQSSVRAHIENKMITANIVLPDETYHIEVSAQQSKPGKFKKQLNVIFIYLFLLTISHLGDMCHIYPTVI